MLKNSWATNDTGKARIGGIDAGIYTFTLARTGYLPLITTFQIANATHTTQTVFLRAGFWETIQTTNANIRSGPGTAFFVFQSLTQGQEVALIGRSQDNQWVVTLTESGNEGWLLVSALDPLLDLAQLPVVVSPATPTPSPSIAATPTPAPLPPPVGIVGGGVAGANLLTNPGFENGVEGWRFASLPLPPASYSTSDYPAFIHSGNYAASLYWGSFSQLITNLTPGTTYRFGIWFRHWSSPNEDRTSSYDPDPIYSLFCISYDGTDNVHTEVKICTSQLTSFDTWSYISIDAVATGPQMSVLINLDSSTRTVKNRHNEVVLDDAVFGIAPVSATPSPTPIPYTPPVRPAPIPFMPTTLRDSMIQLRYNIEQLGGVLDRLADGTLAICLEYTTYYRTIVESATYTDVSSDWQGIYNEYLYATENVINTNQLIYTNCVTGHTRVSEMDYGFARPAINDSLNHLIPAIEAANALITP